LAAMLAILLAGCVSKGPTPELQQHLASLISAFPYHLPLE
jgi:hypothetical protein